MGTNYFGKGMSLAMFFARPHEGRLSKIKCRMSALRWTFRFPAVPLLRYCSPLMSPMEMLWTSPVGILPFTSIRIKRLSERSMKKPGWFCPVKAAPRAPNKNRQRIWSPRFSPTSIHGAFRSLRCDSRSILELQFQPLIHWQSCPLLCCRPGPRGCYYYQ